MTALCNVKVIWPMAAFLVLQGCATAQQQEKVADLELACIGSTELTGALATKFDPVEDEALLASTLGKPLDGKLCQGKVYQSNTDVTLYRAWNSTNPHSKYGNWWAFDKPEGLIAQYRKDYEICYQWSPLDKMLQCKMKAGTKVVVGNGQSAQCSAYLTYDVSKKQQVFLDDSSNAMLDCEEFDGVMTWQ